MNIPYLSDDVLSDEDAVLLAIECRRGILVGEIIHYHQTEALCCYIIKQYEREYNALREPHAVETDTGI